MTYPLPDDPWDSPNSPAFPPQQPHNPQHSTIHIGQPPAPRGSSKNALAIVGVVVAVCCGLGAISIVGAALSGDPKPDSPPHNAAAATTPVTSPPATDEPASLAIPSSSPSAAVPPPQSSPSPKPTPKQSTAKASPTPQKTTSSPKPSCDPNYAGACVPIASDVDCGGGSGNGPAYFYGTAQVVGSDVYDLDRDNDGTACEKD